MRIAFVANHSAGGNDDEGAVTHALASLGHDVQRLDERRGHLAGRLGADMLLSFKWGDFATVRQLDAPKVAWYFDRVDDPDPATRARSDARARWMREAAGALDLVFATDGDAVANDTTGKLVWLPQGADERIGPVPAGRQDVPILFTGIRNGGERRASWVDEMRASYGSSFVWHARGLHGGELAGAVGRAKIVVAPDAPLSDRYFSNRVFLTSGLGGFLLHPYSAALAGMYEDGKELVLYRDRRHLRDLIAHYLGRPEERRAIAEAGLARTRAQHLYRHRVAELVRIVKERLF